MKVLLETLAAAASGLFIALPFWLAIEMDNDELQAGKSPHSGFTPDCPQAFDGFDKPSRAPRYGESNNQ